MKTKPVGDYQHKLDPQKRKGFKKMCDFFDKIYLERIWDDEESTHPFLGHLIEYSIPFYDRGVDDVNKWLRSQEGQDYHDIGKNINIKYLEGREVWVNHYNYFISVRWIVESGSNPLYYSDKQRKSMNFFGKLGNHLMKEQPYKRYWNDISPSLKFIHY
jgi:hypothetical protein